LINKSAFSIMSKTISLAKSRGIARKMAMQAIYQWQMTADDVVDIENQFIEENDMSKVDKDYFSELLFKISSSNDLDAILEKYMDRKINMVDPVERSILRIACYELKLRLDVPYKVVINEAISLTKIFCAEQSHKFVNAVLDKVAKELRVTETTTS